MDLHRDVTINNVHEFAILPPMLQPFARPMLFVRLLAWPRADYLRKSGVLLGWLVLRAGAQAVLVVLLARLLGASDYGVFVAAIAVASLFSPLAGFGAQGVVLRDTARSPDLVSVRLGSALRLWSAGALLCTVVGVVAVLVVLPISGIDLALTLVVSGEIVASSLVELVGRVEQARQRNHVYGALQAGLTVVRLGVLVCLLLLHVQRLSDWLAGYGIVSIFYACLVLAFTVRRHRPLFRNASVRQLAKEGLPFAVGAVAFRLQIEFNKPVLARFGSAFAGNFGAAQRAVDVVSLPLLALQDTLAPQVFASREPDAYLLRSGLALVMLALLGGGVLLIASPYLPLLLGNDFAPTAQLLVWLAALPAVQTARNLGNMGLVAAGFRRGLTVVYVTGAVAGVAGTLWLVSLWGMAGAVVATYSAELVTICAQYLVRRSRAWCHR